MRTCQQRRRQQQQQQAWPRNSFSSGYGPMVSPAFPLAAGRYLADAYATATSNTAGLFFADLYWSGDYDIVFIENPETPGTFHYQEIVEAPINGNYFWQVSECEANWQISMTPA